nr:GNAT family N-acetyltransferase [uncultured Desulfobacter sp.]
MPDLLIKLYDLPFEKYQKENFDGEFKIVRPLSCDKSNVLNFVRNEFNERWADECERCFSNAPTSCFIGVKGQRIIGFACYDATAKGFFGPIGINPEERGKEIGTRLLFSCLADMWDNGYGYAVVGWVDDRHINFYEKSTSAAVIPGSNPGIYKRMIEIK